MAVFVDLDDDEEPPSSQQPQQQQQHVYDHRFAMKPEWNGDCIVHTSRSNGALVGGSDTDDHHQVLSSSGSSSYSTAEDQKPRFKSAMTEALGCYPVAMAVASSLDLVSLDNLSRTCWQVHQALLQYRGSLMAHTLHCVNEDVAMDPEDTLRYRARAGNWFYMEDVGHTGGNYNGKSGECARDMVAECRRCARVVCRNCAIKPPASIVLRDRHRRLCLCCAKAPMPALAKPPLLPDTPIDADLMKRAMCTCQTEGVWLCQPCGRSIRGADHDYQSIWRWRNQYGEVIGGLGNGIGDGDRGVICGRDDECLAGKDREHETDCDAADAREHELSNPGSPAPPNAHPFQSWASSSILSPSPSSPPTQPSFFAPSSPPSDSAASQRSTPSPRLPGYTRHEIEGIGGVVKAKRLSMIRVGACVPEWEDEKNKGEILGREVSGRARSWCGWCWRVIPGKKDYERATTAATEEKDEAKGEMMATSTPMSSTT